MTQPSIYHVRPSSRRLTRQDGKLEKDQKTDIFPFNCKETVVAAPSKLFPSHPIDKFDDYSRPVVMHRLCRAVQDYLPELSDEVVVSYALLISR